MAEFTSATMSEKYGDGLRTTQSGRQTYWPSGIPPSGDDAGEQSHLSAGGEAPRLGSNATQVEREGVESAPSWNGSTRAHSFTEPTLADQGADLEKRISRKSKEENSAPEKDPNLVTWDGSDDPENPMNAPKWKKWLWTISFGLTTFNVTFASSVFSTATTLVSEEFGVSSEVCVLGTSLFVLGFAFGPIVFGPLSEIYGRKIPLFTGFAIFAIFQIPVAVAVNLETIMLCRFLGGFFASAPLAIIGGALADFWDPLYRGIAVAMFASATFIGPIAGPIAGGFICDSTIGWRWTAWLTLIMAAFFGILGALIIPETHGPYLLSCRAKKIRFETRNWAIHAEADTQKVDLKVIAVRYLLRPFAMLIREPILTLITIYMAFIYGFLYLCFEAYPIAFQDVRGYNAGVGALPFIAVMIGVLIGAGIIVAFSMTRFKKLQEQHGQVAPEERLLPMIIGSLLLPIGMFWFAWTSSASISVWPQIISGVPIGCGVLLIFMQGLNYIIDVYKMNANSAIAANTFVRSWLGAGFPMFATYMFDRLGVDWAMSLLGFLCVALIPVPILFYIYGAKIRGLSKYSPQIPAKH